MVKHNNLSRFHCNHMNGIVTLGTNQHTFFNENNCLLNKVIRFINISNLQWLNFFHWLQCSLHYRSCRLIIKLQFSERNWVKLSPAAIAVDVNKVEISEFTLSGNVLSTQIVFKENYNILLHSFYYWCFIKIQVMVRLLHVIDFLTCWLKYLELTG